MKQILALTDLSVEVSVYANALPWHHRDPADRFIIATALMENPVVVTDDDRFGDYGVATWV
jgi:PIN domain nuclease of toxin-antitoxin system